MASFLRKNWIAVVIVLQPLLDVLAYWTQNESGTAAGYIRLFLMFVISAYVVLKYKSLDCIKAICIIAVVFLAHIINCGRVGYVSPIKDFIYIAKVIYMPILAICFSCAVNRDDMAEEIIKGLMISAALEALIIIVSGLTDTYVPTYTIEKLGISGWVIDDNRCCHSDIISSLAVFSVFFFLEKSSFWSYFVFISVFAVLISNGTTACYVTLLAVTAGFPAFILIRSLICKEKIDSEKKKLFIFLALLFAASIIALPYTPRYKMEMIERKSYSDNELRFATKMSKYGYDIYNMSLEEKLEDDFVHEELKEYYNHFIFGTVESLGKYDTDRIIRSFDGTINADILGNTRLMKRLYASYIREDSEPILRLTGFEISKLDNPKDDLENDYHAIYYYYGFIGITAYILAILFIVFRIVRLLVCDFKGSLTLLNFTLLMCFFLQLGLAHFSGAMLRRPNASIYLAVVIALIYRQTVLPKKGGESNEA